MKRLYLLFFVLLATACDTQTHTKSPQVSSPESEKVYNWKMVTTWPKNLPGLGTSPERMAKKIEAMSNGRLKIKVYGAGEIVPAMEVFETVSQGTVQLGHGASLLLEREGPSCPVFYSCIVWLDRSRDETGWLLHGGGLELWRELYDRYNLFPYPGWQYWRSNGRVVQQRDYILGGYQRSKDEDSRFGRRSL